LQDQLKERLTGAAILVVVVVLAVPAMFRGRPDAAAGVAEPGESAVPLHTYTLAEGSAATTVQSPGQSVGPPAGQAGDPPVGPPTGAPRAEPSAQPPAQAPPQPPAAAPPEALRNEPVSAPVADPGSETRRAAPRPAVGRPAGTAAPKGGWAVQVGSFRVRELADRMAREVNAKGFKVHVAGPDGRGLYRVRTAFQADKEAALALRQQMASRGLKPIVNASP
jgi:DedD protein